MDAPFWFNVLMRWLHVGAAAAALGASLTLRFVVLPASERSGNDGLLAQLRPALKKLVHGALGLLILTGLYNYLVPAMGKLHQIRDQVQAGILPASALERMAPYHPVMGLKIILAVILFGLAIVLLKPVPAFQKNRRAWLTVNVVIGLTIFALAAYLRRLWA